MNLVRVSELYGLITQKLLRKPTMVLDPTPATKPYRLFGNARDVDMNVAIDPDEWVVPDELRSFIDEIIVEDSSVEDKIIKIYQKICEDYTYDDNVLSYITKDEEGCFHLPDEYGRNTDKNWRAHRSKHNRRTCFEVSRMLAKSLIELFEKSKVSKNYDVCIIWDEPNTHYFVGLASDNYYAMLDLDDFSKIKDLTRVKTGLTIDGIVVLEDSKNIFTSVLKKFNFDRKKYSQDAVVSEALTVRDGNALRDTIQSNNLKFIQYTIKILKEKYHLDPAGIFEYVKEIVDLKIGSTARHTYWKEVDNSSGMGKRYARCLTVTIDGTEYLIDVTQTNFNEIFREFSKDDGYIPFKMMRREYDKDPSD